MQAGWQVEFQSYLGSMSSTFEAMDGGECAGVLNGAPSRPREAEEDFIQFVSLPLNLQGNQQHPFPLRLTAIRAAAKEQARRHPVSVR